MPKKRYPKPSEPGELVSSGMHPMLCTSTVCTSGDAPFDATLLLMACAPRGRSLVSYPRAYFETLLVIARSA